MELEARDEESAKVTAEAAQAEHQWDDKTARRAYGRLMFVLAEPIGGKDSESVMASLEADRKMHSAAFKAIKRRPSTMAVSRDASELQEVGLLRGERSVCLVRLVREVLRRGVKGDIVECGVQNGESAAVWAQALASSRITGDSARLLWLYDSFAGMPRSTAEDTKITAGPNVGDLAVVKAKMRQAGLSIERVRLKVGYFEDTFKTDAPGPIAVLHVDGDYYSSVLLTLRTFYDRVAEGGMILIDDFGSFDGARKAFYVFIRERDLMPLVHKYDPERLYWVKGEEHTAGIDGYDGLCYNPTFSINPTGWERATQPLAEPVITLRSDL